MSSADESFEREQRSPAERLIERSLIDGAGIGRPLSDRARQRQRSIEAYLRGEMLPRYIQRAAEIERAIRAHERELRQAYRELREACGDDAHGFARRWTARAQAWDFEEVNRLIGQHNDWYPIERDLPMDPRTGDFVLVSGRPYRREELGPEWVLERYPPA